MIYLYGPPGSGKTTLGKVLAERLHLPFIDLDELIVATSGKSIPAIFESEGEAGFRKRESDALHSLTNNPEQVIALGGGTLLAAENRRLVENQGQIICLNAPAEILLARMDSTGGNRPLLQDHPSQRLEVLLRQRKTHYASFPLKMDSSNSTPDHLSRRIELLLGRFHVTGMGSGYDVRVKAGCMNGIGNALALRKLVGPIAVISDETVAGLYGSQVIQSLNNAGYLCSQFIFPPGEKNKNIQTVINVWNCFLSSGLERSSTVLALGGGVTGDLAGFAASAFKRGLRWVYLPTSLLSMADACLGGKTGVDLPEGKNLVGAFHPPSLVWVDPETLNTLTLDEQRSGMAEVVKAGLVANPSLFNACSQGWKFIRENWTEILTQSMQVKIDIIETDPYEKGPREALNLGHTIGHALEHASGYRLRHGEAISIGMVAEARLAERLGIASAGLASQISECLTSLGLPTAIPDRLQTDKLITIMLMDKKRRGGKIRFALPVEIGRVQIGVEVEPWQIFSS